MPHIRLSFTTKQPHAEQLYQILDNAFEEEGYPLALTEIDEKTDLYEVSLYIETDDPARMQYEFATLCAISYADVALEFIPDIDWVSCSLAKLKPVRAGRFFVHGSHDRDKVNKNDFAIEIDAGQAFGTGHHDTTASCLAMISKHIETLAPRNALDLGTGSGVLAIALAMAYKIPVLASDIDPIAISVATDNVRLNGVSQYIDLITADGFAHPNLATHAPFELIIANILANPLIALAPEMVSALAPRGGIILSGILEEQGTRVLQAYQSLGLDHHDKITQNGWVCLYLTR
ncbi:50S ribosomal protein L11 methyltransferase [Bartonella sp. DGB2]|uniref:50S ribosomal protein L11 methyltransferase n=1 Tax=Bartonella sp. DGB2 TaxID=3388426 RepID=UPI00398FCD57